MAYEYVRCLRPMQTLKAFEDAAYALPIGEISMPVRTKLGFHLIQVHSRKPNPGRVHVAHILLAYPKEGTAQDSAAVKKEAEAIYQQLKAGADFGELASRCSADSASAKKQGELPWFGVGEMVAPFEEAAFQLTTPGSSLGWWRHVLAIILLSFWSGKDVPPLSKRRSPYGARWDKANITLSCIGPLTSV